MSELPPKEDRRKERTRQLLRDALLDLIIEKGYEDISIQNITERANVARPTFYLHYKDKEELLFNSLREIYDNLVSHFRAQSPQTYITNMLSGEKVDASDFQHVAEYIDFYRVMLSKKGSLAFLLQVLDYLQGVMEHEVKECLNLPNTHLRLPVDLMGSFLAGAHIGVIHWWLKQHPEYSVNEVARMTNQLSFKGLVWAVGLGADQPEMPPEA